MIPFPQDFKDFLILLNQYKVECFNNKIIELIESVPVYIIGLADLKKNKAASGRPKDLNDLQYLP